MPLFRYKPSPLARLVLLAVVAFGLYQGGLQLTGNFHEVVPGELYRSNQLHENDISEYVAQYHIRSVLNLRGENKGTEWYDEEIKDSKEAKIKHLDFRMSAKRELTDAQVAQLVSIMKNAPKPLLIHCKSGADRTGLASALYLLKVKKEPTSTASHQLSLVYGHWSLAFLRAYAMDRTFKHVAAQQAAPIALH